MKTISQALGLKTKQLKELGIEIEVEGMNLPHPDYFDNSVWHTDKDTSLRGESAEFILNSPVDLDEVMDSLRELGSILKKAESTIIDTYRAGIHVHVNVQDLTTTQAITMACAYYIFEEALINWCLPSRRGNHFCLRVADAEYVTFLLRKCLCDNHIRYLNTDEIRYASLNFKSLFQHGSLEFRALESTTDWDRIYTWCSFLSRLKKVSQQFDDPRDLLQAFRNEGTIGFTYRFFSELSPLLICDGYEEMLRRGASNCRDIAFAREWNKTNHNIFNLKDGVF